jgi:hypothetical protein
VGLPVTLALMRPNEREIMTYMKTITIKDENGYREESWDLAGDGYDKMQDTLDEQLADGIILDWYIEN